MVFLVGMIPVYGMVFFFFFLDNLEYTKQCDICIIIYVYVIEQFILVVLIIRSLYNHTPEAPRS